ncbi:MAG: nicotinate-nicotinamide nucleotide adenylyltransferase [Pseudomonadota bacterium]
MHIAIFGSAFNPPTLGHADVIKQVIETHPYVNEIVLVPSFKHAFDKKMMDYYKRIAMLELFASDLCCEKVKVVAIEHLMCRGDTPVYTFDLLEYIENEVFPNARLSFVIGPDNQQNWHKFYKSDEVAKRWHLLCVQERIHIRSTTVRKLLSDNQSIAKLVTTKVNGYLMNHRDSWIE